MKGGKQFFQGGKGKNVNNKTTKTVSLLEDK